MTKFSDLALDPRVLKAVGEAGYETPTPIQASAIPYALEGRDVLGIAQTGTGKTASFTLPLISKLSRGRARARMPRSLVLAPTRELAAQVAENFDIYAKHTKLTKALLIGGVSFGGQDKLIDRGVDVLIATPGRLLDHFERGKLLLTGVEVMVIDEADRMLDMGFIPDIEHIFKLLHQRCQILFFSATMAPEIERITKTFLKNPAKIEVARQNSTSSTITQTLITFTPSHKNQTFKEKRIVLRNIIKAEADACKNAIIFCNRKVDVDIVAKSLRSHGLDAAALHGDLDQSQRTKTLDAFRDGELKFLVASDVAARGLDIPAVSHVFNFDVPIHAEDYVHRIGRTGRAGREGRAFTITVPAEGKYVGFIEKLVGNEISKAALPEGAVEELAKPASRSNKNTNSRNERKPTNKSTTEQHSEQIKAAPHKKDNKNTDRNIAHKSTSKDALSDTKEERSSQHKDKNQEQRNRNNTHTRSDDHPIIGMGDHVPDFLLRSFKTTEVKQPSGTSKALSLKKENDTQKVKFEKTAPQSIQSDGDHDTPKAPDIEIDQTPQATPTPKSDTPQNDEKKPAPKKRASRARKPKEESPKIPEEI